MIPYGRQDISAADIEAVASVLTSDFLTQGPVVPMFEEAVSKYVGSKFAVAANSATSALHLACLALEVGVGDLVWTSANTFVASANCALYCGATIDFIDIDLKTYNLCINSLKVKLVKAKEINALPKVLIAVHFAGQPCDMESIHNLSREYGFAVIEDGSHAIGSNYQSQKVGSCQYSDITVFSFHPVKIITTGEGGMALTNNPNLCRKLRLFRSHGITSDKQDFEPRPGAEIWNYQQIALGYNYRMTDIAAALGLSQINRIEDFVTKRQEIASVYDKALEGLALILPWQAPFASSSYHLYPIRLQLDAMEQSQKQIYQQLLNDEIYVNIHYIPVYLQPFYQSKGFVRGYCPNAEKYYSEVLSLPIFPGLSAEMQDSVIRSLKRTIR
jgi:UDP-4-amino-4,6-dideoxy-N-acetyl-beta-L-altrosamine transaminase